tara:strand:+ start:26175 stop:27794 length:1620 start_codon:yes stop_codon:yes gene_type:complete
MKIFFSCAAIQMPTGGPKDEIPPQLVNSFPMNGASFFKGEKVELTFSEHLDENSVYQSISMMPTLENKFEIFFKGKVIIIEFLDTLMDNQTYIISIDRNLKDEHKVPISNGIQIAFATGEVLDNSTIAGRITHSNQTAAQLWRVKNQDDLHNFYNRKPDYIVDASDDGSFMFNFLSPGVYKLVGIDRSLAGIKIDPNKTQIGLPWYLNLKLEKDQELLDVDIIIPKNSIANKINRVEWVTDTWFKLNFDHDVSNIINILPLQVFYKNLKIEKVDKFIDPKNRKLVHLILPPIIDHPGLITFASNSLKMGQQTLLDSIKIDVRTDTLTDKSNLSINLPEIDYIHSFDYDTIVPLKINFSSPMRKTVQRLPTLLLNDSTSISSNSKWISPLTLEIYPEDNWMVDSKYKIKIDSENISPIFQEVTVDSVIILPFKTKGHNRYGRLLGQIDSPLQGKVIAMLTFLDKKSEDFYTVVNSDGKFSMDRLKEGKYRLIIFEDRDNDNNYSFGGIDPYIPSERFSYYPDTLNIRGNWDMELSNIEFK